MNSLLPDFVVVETTPAFTWHGTFGIIVCTGDLGLHDRIEIRNDNHVPIQKVPVVRSVEVVTNPGKMLAIDIDCNPSLRVFGGVVQPIKLDGSRSEEQEISEIAIEAWQLFHRLLAECCGDVRPFRFEQRSFCGDVDGLGELAPGWRVISTVVTVSTATFTFS